MCLCHIKGTFSCGTKGSDYSISDSPEPDLKTVPISLHTTHFTWPMHVNQTNPHPGGEVSTEISSQIDCRDLFQLLATQ
jgi:hypothetical protein